MRLSACWGIRVGLAFGVGADGGDDVGRLAAVEGLEYGGHVGGCVERVGLDGRLFAARSLASAAVGCLFFF